MKAMTLLTYEDIIMGNNDIGKGDCAQKKQQSEVKDLSDIL